MLGRRWFPFVVLIVSALAATAGSVALAQSSGKGKGKEKEEVASMRLLRGVNFVSACRFSHRAPDDPIVLPGAPGKSHDHSFVGNTSTNAFSTFDTLQSARTTCHRRGDTAAYWMPTLLVDGHAVAPMGATIYYRRRTLDRVTAFPAGLRVVAGNPYATSAQDLRVTFWNCGVLGGFRPMSTVPDCPGDRRMGLRLHVTFPNCWDGKNLDSADHASHMAYSLRGSCPSSHPVAVPAISLIYRYGVGGGHEVELTSRGEFSAHADFFNAWDQRTLERLVDRCLNALRHCGKRG